MKALWYTIKNIPKLYFQFRKEIKASNEYAKSIAKNGLLDTMLREFEELEEHMPYALCQMTLQALLEQYKENGEERDKVHEVALHNYCDKYAVEY